MSLLGGTPISLHGFRVAMGDALAVVEHVAQVVLRIGIAFFDIRSVLDTKLAEQEAKQQPAAPEGEEVDPLRAYRKEQEEYRLTKAKRKARELRNARDACRVVPSEFAVYALCGTSSEIATIFDTLPLTIHRKHPELARRYLHSFERELNRARNTAAELPEKLPALLDGY